MQRGEFILLEGLDGSGKTKIGSKLAEMLDYSYFDSMPDLYRSHQKEFRAGLGETAFYIHMLGMLKHTSDIIGQLRDEGRGVILSRYYPSTVACHVARAGREGRCSLDPSSLDLEQPDYSYFLHIDEQRRRELLIKRGDLSIDDSLTLESGFSEALIREYDQFPLKKINVTGRWSSDVAGELIEDISLARLMPDLPQGQKQILPRQKTFG